MKNDSLKPVLERIANALERLAPKTPILEEKMDSNAYVWDTELNQLKGVENVSRLDLTLLKGLEQQTQILYDNTKQFAEGLPANNALLWGARGTGKSSLIKAIHGDLNENTTFSVILVEIFREDINSLPALLDRLKNNFKEFGLSVKKFAELMNIYWEYKQSRSKQMTNKKIANKNLIEKIKSKRKIKKISEQAILVPNTYIVHNFHGIGLYEGTVVKKIKGVEKDYLEIKFAGTDKLFVPSEQINELEVYIGGENPRLSHLGGAEWERAKEKAKQNAKIIADRVLNLYKLRNIRNDSLIIGEDTPWQNEIENSFEYIETPDQLTAINDVKKDLEKNIPMDRLIFGDVGFGKTEVALRAAIKVAFSGGQVALLAPTTILVQQHIDTFVDRLKDYPLNIKHLSRFVTKKEVQNIVEGVKDGSVDILIGTHRILSDDIEFQNLKLLIIDEEHRFGVEDKDRLQSLSNQVHKLTLTATPIPRTLEQSLMGIRETSRIETPPENRLETLTHVGNIDESTIALAIQREISRGGQVFFVLNRIEELQVWMKKIQEVFPNLNHRLLHGQLATNQIEQTMQDVWDKKVDVLFATTIVEAGIDLPKVNTLITLRSELLGMSQLYQLKGRVGRRREQSFAYFFHNTNLGVDAELRLDAIKSIGQTSTGYSLAMKDLQLRGSGSILGDIQSGFIANVGLNIFNKYVIDSIEGKSEDKSSILETEIKLDCYWGSSIPKSYIDADSERIDIYKRLEHSEPNKVDEIKNEIGSGIVAVISTEAKKASLVVGVSKDLEGKYNAIDLVRLGVTALGGKGGGGRWDMAQAGGSDYENGELALEQIKKAISQ